MRLTSGWGSAIGGFQDAQSTAAIYPFRPCWIHHTPGPEYQKLSEQEQYEDERTSKKEKDAALQMVAEKRGGASVADR